VLVAQERGRRQRTFSASRIRRTWLRAIAIPRARAAAVSVSSVQWAACVSSAGASEPSACRTGCPGGVSATKAISRLRSASVSRGLRRESALNAFLAEHDALAAVSRLRAPLLLMHAEGDDQIPADHSAALHEAAASARKRLIVVPGGHHRSVQHDAELQGESLRFIDRALAAGG
jgi:fermentation-respiration switch protein FrsA (DUF1100 family)